MSMLFVSVILAASAQGGVGTGGRAPKAIVRECPDIATPLRGSSGPVTCRCPAVEADMLGTSVWGSEVYTDDSNICLAAIHDGRITIAGGPVTLWPAPGQQRYTSATRNGISSMDYTDFEGSFRFSTPGANTATKTLSTRPPVPVQTRPASGYQSGQSVGACPETGQPLRGTKAPLTCECPAILPELLGTSVWGNMVYTDDSSICRAAIHDGRVSISGGTITVWAAPGQARYGKATRNGITSIDYPGFEGSIRFTPPQPPARKK